MGFLTEIFNLYRSEAELFTGGETILSREGTTRGDPLSMAIYAVSTLPLIQHAEQPDLILSWFADDASAGASLVALFSWWSTLLTEGPKYGYFVNPPWTWLLVKPEH